MSLLINSRNCFLKLQYSHSIRKVRTFILRSELHNHDVKKYRLCTISPQMDLLVRSFSCFSLKHSEALVVPSFATRTFSSSSPGNSYHEKQETRRRTLLLLTYLSGFIGVCLLSAVGFRQYAAFANRARGIEELRVREYGRTHKLYKYRGYVLPDFVVGDVKGIHTFDVREDDIWVVSFPKAGTTWVQEIIYLIVTDCDFAKASEKNIVDRFPYFEYIVPGKKVIDIMPSPRLIKSHLPMSLLPNQIADKKPKIIYIGRNPKDTIVSYYQFMYKFLSDSGVTFSGTFEKYCQLFTEDQVQYGPWWKHVREAWSRKDDENILVLFYEDMKVDLRKVVLDIAKFLGKPLTNEAVDAIVNHCSFESMKNNKSVNYDWMKDYSIANKNASFMRKGEVGDWKNHLSADIIQKLDDMVATKLQPAGVPIRDCLPETK